MTTIPADLANRLADHYVLEREIGRGGMATVYLARDRKHDRRVAVKVLRADLGPVLGGDRFLREIEIAARLSHPHILPLYDSGNAEGTLYYVMPYVEGESVRGLLNRVRLVDVGGVREIVRRVADALDYAHRQGIVHRDIKPENILLPAGHAVVTDFGIARAVSEAVSGRLTQTGIALGTPGYMSPEQAAGLTNLDPATDVYSVAVVAYEMLTGSLPGAWLTPDALGPGRFPNAATEPRALLDRLPAGVERALVRALQLRAEDRFPTTGEFADALEHPETMAVPVSAEPPVPIVDRRASRDAPRLPTSAPPHGLGAPSPETPWLGGPLTITAERELEGELLPEDLELLVDEIRANLGHQGHVHTTGRSVLWLGRAPRKPFDWTEWDEMMKQEFAGSGPDIAVRVMSRHGRTRIRVEQRLKELAGGLFGGIVGGAGGGIGVAVAVLGTLAMDIPPGVTVPAAFGVAGGVYALTRKLYRGITRTRQRALERLADRLAEYVQEAAVP
jgi:serine/threonine protein kinase